MKRHMMKKIAMLVGVVGLPLLATAVFAEGGDIVSVATKVTTQATAIVKLLNVAAYVAGVGFALAGVLQFKAHKENPQQVPLSKPVVMIVVSACLLFLPSVLDIAGASLFGGEGKKAIEASGS
jgi:intracellular multiplication protein IcmD